MAREFFAGSLADGQVQDAKTPIYTAPNSSTDVAVYVRSLSLYSTNAAEQTVLLWITRALGGSRRWRPRYVLAQNESAEVLSEGEVVLLSPGDSIEAQTTTDNGVDFVVTGVEEVEA